MLTDEDPPRGLMFYWDLGFTHILRGREDRRRRCEHPHLRGKDRLFLRENGSPDPRCQPFDPRPSSFISHNVLISSRKSAPPQYRQLNILISISKQ